MENDTQLYQSQLEAKKKMQVDLEKELQSSLSEITKLTSLIDGFSEITKLTSLIDSKVQKICSLIWNWQEKQPICRKN